MERHRNLKTGMRFHLEHWNDIENHEKGGQYEKGISSR